MYSWKDRLIDWANAKGAWTHIVMGAGIALIITAIILAAAMPSKGMVSTNAAGIGELRTAISVVWDQLGTKAGKADLEGINNTLNHQTGVVNGLCNRVDSNGDRLNDIEGDIAALNDSLAEVRHNLIEVYLTGTFGNYALHIKSSKAGNFTANVHLVYLQAIGNATSYAGVLDDFYSSINFTEPTPIYIPVATFNGTAWGISEVWFNTGKVVALVNNELVIPITCVGLNSTWEPDFAYVEMYQILEEAQ